RNQPNERAVASQYLVNIARGALGRIDNPGTRFRQAATCRDVHYSPDDKATRKLTIGGVAPNGMSFAKVDEREGTFALSAPDLNALKLPLVAHESPSPPPSATATATP